VEVCVADSSAGARRFDVFISYGHADADWTGALADNLVRRGLRVWQDRYELVAGDLLAQQPQKGRSQALSLALVVSKNSLGRPCEGVALGAGDRIPDPAV
jgi:hypothetical protein